MRLHCYTRTCGHGSTTHTLHIRFTVAATVAKGRPHRNPSIQGHTPYAPHMLHTRGQAPLQSPPHKHTQPQYSDLPRGTARSVRFNLPLSHTSQTPLRRQPPSRPGPRASFRTPYSCERVLRGESGALAGTQRAPGLGIFPLWARHGSLSLLRGMHVLCVEAVTPVHSPRGLQLPDR